MFVSSRSELSEFRKRYRWMRLFVALTFLVLVGRLVQLQLIDGDQHHQESLSNVIRTVPIPAVRGRMFDSKGLFLIPTDRAGEDALMELALEAGADDVKEDAGNYEVTCDPDAYQDVSRALAHAEIQPEVSQITRDRNQVR